MFNKVLIANRGEIAVRIIRACKEMEIKTVAVYSNADKEAMHVKLADEAYCIGPSTAKDSYLHIPSIMTVAIAAKVDAIHPGYGFLAENPDFAEICSKCHITFIGPNPASIHQMGEKATARETMKRAGIPIVPGTDGLINNMDEAMIIAKKIGYPVIVKATAGGGGKGMRLAYNKDELQKAIGHAKTEAETAFGNAGVYLEKYLEEPRHIEVQIIADRHGNIIHLGERDCSIQRRHQKLIEEAPSPKMTEALRIEMGEVAVRAAKAVHYDNVGTVEFLLDKFDHFYFMEMNTRIQVEHPVTELVTGLDLIKEQISIAAGYPLSLQQKDIKMSGWAIECRINAEDPTKNFIPFPGKVEVYQPPGGFGIRIDSAVYAGYEIPPFYDSMIAKVIVLGKDRHEAIQKMKQALREFCIAGIKTTTPFHLKLLEHEQFVKGDFHTKFLENISITLDN